MRIKNVFKRLASSRPALLLLVPLLIMTSTVQATNYREDSFEYFGSSDVIFYSTGLVFNELHLQEKKKLVLISGEVITPVQYIDGASFNLTGSSNYSIFDAGYDSYSNWDGATFLDNADKKTDAINVFIGDFNGDGHSDQLLQPKATATGVMTDGSLILIYGSNNDLPSAVETIVDPLYNETVLKSSYLSANNVSISISDLNGDGISDIRMEHISGDYANKYVVAVAYGSSTGMSGVAWEHSNGPAYTSSNNSSAATKPSNGDIIPGGTSGSFRVNESGAATFALPLHTPKGPAGMAVGISLNYSSQSGNGPLGVGWSVGAGSAITGCPNSEANSTPYCLNGTKLVRLEGGTDAEQLFATEITDISTITGHFEAYAAVSFEVLKKDGTKHEYSKIGQSTWAIDKIWNPSRSAYTQYEYLDVGSGDYKKTTSGFSKISIKTAAGAIVAETVFSYETRPDDMIVYIDGDNKILNKRVNRITIFESGSEVRNYHLAYNRSALTGRSTLKYMQECGLNNSCYEPLAFNWTGRNLTSEVFSKVNKGGVARQQPLSADFNRDGYTDLAFKGTDSNYAAFKMGPNFESKPYNPNYSPYQNDETEQTFIQFPMEYGYTSTRNSFSLDINADGYPDISVLDVVRTVSLGGGDYVYEVRLTNYLNAGDKSRLHFIDQDTITFRSIHSSSEIHEAFQNITLSDVNGDALLDIVYLTSSDGNTTGVRAYLQNKDDRSAIQFDKNEVSQSGYALQKPTFIDNFVGISQGYSLTVWDADKEEYTSGREAYFTDFNNDGYLDVLFKGTQVTTPVLQDKTYKTGWFVGYSKAALNSELPFKAMSILPLIADDKVLLADFNGDGYTDIHSETNLVLNTGKFSFESTSAMLVVNDTYPLKDYTPIELNADGITDFAILKSDRLEVAYNESGRLTFYDNLNDLTGSDYFSPFNADLNGDGVLDVMLISENGDITSFTKGVTSFDDNTPADFINGIVSSNGIETKIEYAAGILDESVYQADSDAMQPQNTWALDSPVFDVTGAVHLVKRVTEDSPTIADSSATVSKRYSYVGGKLQAGGRGFLGFRKLVVVDETFNVKTVTEYAQQFPYQGMPLYTYKVHSNTTFDDGGIIGFVSEDIYQPAANASTQAGLSPLSNLDVNGNVTTGDGQDEECRSLINTGSDAGLTWLSCERNILNVKEFATAGIYPELFTSNTYPAAKYNPVFPYIETAIEEVYHTKTEFDGTPQFIGRGSSAANQNILKTTVTKNEYAGNVGAFYGDLTKQTTITSVTSGSTTISHNLVSEFKYDDNNVTNWWLGRMTEQLVTSSFSMGVTGTVSSRSGSSSAPAESSPSLVDYDLSYFTEYLDDARDSVERKTTFSYDPSTGFLESSTVEPDNADLAVKTTYTYDTWGNKNTVTKESIAGVTEGLDFWRKAETSYDSNGVYPEFVYEYTASGTKRLTSQVTSRHALGMPQTTVGQNNVTTNKTYDGFGRITNTTSSLGAYSDTSYAFCSADIYCPNTNLGYLVVTETSNAAPTQKTFSDKLGQTLRVSKVSFDGSWIHADSQYDKVGNLTQTSSPFFGSSSSFETKFDYDIFGRAIRTTFADGTNQFTQYDGFYTTSTNHLGLSKATLINAVDNPVYVKEFTSTGDAETVLKEVFYKQDLQGKQTQIEADGAITITGYNLIGESISKVDPVKGTWVYSKNALGELITLENPNGEITTNTYDDLGRALTRTIKSGATTLENTTWHYDAATNGIGQIDSISGSFSYVGMNTSYAYGFTYNANAQVETKTTIIDGVSYKEKWTYDSVGRNNIHYDASNGNTNTPTIGTKTHYNNENYVSGLSDATGSHFYFTPLETDVFGNVTQFQYGNGVITNVAFEEDTGRLQSLSSGLNSNYDEILDYFYQYDAIGNLDYKKDFNLGYKEDFAYDTTYRLTDVVSTGFFTDAQLGQVADYNLSITYMPNSSRIATKSNYENGATYNYGAADKCNGGQCGIHVLTSIGNLTFDYDKQGNRLTETRSGVVERSNEYTAYDKPWSITKGANTSKFAYGASGERIKQVAVTDGSTKTTLYVGGVEWIQENGSWTYKRRIAGYALEEQQTDASVKLSYLHKDYQGSVVAITNQSGVIQQRLSYDVYGARRDVLFNHATGYIKPGASFYDQIGVFTYNGELNAAVRQMALDTRGYTGHEHLDGVGLIHMNGRVFDPVSALFLSADPTLPDTSNSYYMNRFSYTLNNPVSYTDPSGYWSLTRSIRHIGRQIRNSEAAKLAITIAITYYTAGMGTGWVGAGWSMAGGFASGFVMTGTLRGAVQGAIFAGASFGVGEYASTLQAGVGREVVRTAMHATLGGIRAEMAGGSFSSGFKAAGMVTVVSHAGGFAKAGIESKGGQIAAAAVIGGTVSEMSGGKFANGAVSAAFAEAYNKQSHLKTEKGEMTCSDGYCYQTETQRMKVADKSGLPYSEWKDVRDTTFDTGLNNLTKGKLQFAVMEVKVTMEVELNITYDSVVTTVYSESSMEVLNYSHHRENFQYVETGRVEYRNEVRTCVIKCLLPF